MRRWTVMKRAAKKGTNRDISDDRYTSRRRKTSTDFVNGRESRSRQNLFKVLHQNYHHTYIALGPPEYKGQYTRAADYTHRQDQVSQVNPRGTPSQHSDHGLGLGPTPRLILEPTPGGATVRRRGHLFTQHGFYFGATYIGAPGGSSRQAAPLLLYGLRVGQNQLPY